MIFFKVLITMFIAEMGDKTQLLLVAMASKYKIRHIIIGTGAAIIVLNALAVGLGSLLNQFIPMSVVKLVAGLAFFLFAYSSLKDSSNISDDHKEIKKGKFGPILSIFGTFFLAELGDKTQLTALAFSADSGMSDALSVFLACSIGLFAADMLGLAVGYLLKSKLPDGILSVISFFIFSIFGIITILEAFGMFFGEFSHFAWLYTLSVTILFTILCILTYIKKIKSK